MRAIALVVVAAGCAGCFHLDLDFRPAEGTGPPACTPALLPGPSACDATPPPDIDGVRDLASFRRIASVAVCDWSLRCGWGAAGDSFCRPEFAALDAARVASPGGFDLGLARSCVARLDRVRGCAAAAAIAVDCLSVSRGGPGGAPLEGETCAGTCALDLVCLEGRCVEPQSEGDLCDGASPCETSCTCRGGRCARAGVGEDCAGLDCADGLECRGTPSWFVETPPFRCRAYCEVPLRPHHVGCACETDADCPTDVAACDHGVCAFRPFPDETCSADGPACFGSTCDGAICRRAQTGGACQYDVDCIAGLRCSAQGEPFGTWGLCGPDLHRAEPCGPAVAGRCADGLTCHHVCV